jgi:TatD DNase family protein
MIDTHCHIDMQEFDADRAEVIERAVAGGIEALVAVSSDAASILKVLEAAASHSAVYAALGLHPHNAKDFSDQLFDALVALARNPKVVAIGETGLDYHHDHCPRDVQRAVLERHAELAQLTGLPLIVHSREAQADTLDALKKCGVTNGVLHCFSGDADMAREVVSMGLCISIAGPVTYKKNDALREVVKIIPDQYLLLETDAPYLSPEPLRGRRNEPAFIFNTAQVVADVRGVTLDDIQRITTINAKRLFGIGHAPREGEIAYKIRNSLYLNITNRCPNRCSFCVRFKQDYVKGHYLHLLHEPSVLELQSAIGDLRDHDEIVFCGYGEPLIRLDTVTALAAWIKEKGGIVRINTNGQGSLIHGRDILPEFKGLVDRISISLDAHDEATYNRLCLPSMEGAYAAVLDFIKKARGVIPDVTVTVVDAHGVDIEKCRAIADELGVKFRLRHLDTVG